MIVMIVVCVVCFPTTLDGFRRLSTALDGSRRLSTALDYFRLFLICLLLTFD